MPPTTASIPSGRPTGNACITCRSRRTATASGRSARPAARHKSMIEDAIRGAIAPDGRTLAFLRDEQHGDIVGAAAVYVASPMTAAPRRHTRSGSAAARRWRLAFSPDGRTLGLAAVPRTIGLAAEQRGWQFWTLPVDPDAPARRRLTRWTDVVPRISSFSWLPDGRHVVLAARTLSTPGTHLWVADLTAIARGPSRKGPAASTIPRSRPPATRSPSPPASLTTT